MFQLYIKDNRKCVFSYIQEIPLFLFCFPGYLRFFLCIGFAKIYGVFLYSIFSLYVLSRKYGIYIQVVLSFCILPRFGGIFLYIGISLYIWNITLSVMCFLYIQNNTLYFSLFCPEFVYFPINAFFFLYIQEIDTFSFQVLPREYSYI